MAACGRVTAARCRMAAAGPVTSAVYAMRMRPVAAALASSHRRQGRHRGYGGTAVPARAARGPGWRRSGR